MSVEAERAIVGAVLLDNAVAHELELSAEEFSSADWGSAYKTAMEIISDGHLADLVTVSEALGNQSAWLECLGRACKDVPSPQSAPYYAPQVRAEHRRRQAMQIAEDLKLGVVDQPESAVDTAINALMDLNTDSERHEWTLRECSKAAVERVDSAFNSSGPIGVMSGFPDLDDAIGGFQEGDLYVIGARPSMGKTALLLNLAAGSEARSGIISAEQDYVQIGTRMLASHGRVNLRRLRTGDMRDEDWPRLANGAAATKDLPVYINDLPSMHIDQLHRQARKWRHREDIQILFIDYLQRIEAPGRNRVEQVAHISRRLKTIARELNIPVVSLAQVKREVESRNDKRPGMADLADCSEIEKDTDCIATLYRDEVYHEDSKDQGIAELIVCKNRHGPIGAVRLNYEGPYVRFSSITNQY